MNKGDIVAKLRDRGFSRRDSVQILNFILEEMAEALKRGEEVELLSFGWLKKVRHPRKKRRGWYLHKVATIYKQPYTVRLEVSEAGEELVAEKKREGRFRRPPRA